MNNKLLHSILMLLFLIVNGAIFRANGQTVTVNCIGTTGSYKSGFVSSTGVITDGNLSVNNVAAQNTPRGWAVFDLSSASLPTGALVTSVSLNFSYITSGNGTSVTCNLYGFPGDLSTVTNGTTLYGNCVNGTSFNSTNWGANATTTPVTISRPFNATGVSFIQNNMNNLVSITFVASSGTNQYTINGYGSTSSLQPQLTIDYLVPCMGQPSPGIAGSSVSSICTGVPFSVALTGATAGTGISYQWESSPGGTGMWQQISGATGTTLNVTSQTSATDYRAIITCSNGGSFDISNTVSIAQNIPTQCYCTATVTSQDELISNVTVANINNNSSGFGTSGYQNFTSQTANMEIGTPYPFSASISPFYSSDVVAVWIDLNQDGVFDNPGERLLLNTPSASPATGTIIIPATAMTGLTRMRVRLVYNSSNPAPCNSSSFGNIEDYSVFISPAPPCPAPYSLTALNITSNAAAVDWLNTSTATSFTIEYGPLGFTPGTGTFLTTTNFPHTLTGLAPNTDYSFYVRGICSAVDSSTQTGPYNFTTLLANDIPSGAFMLTVNAGCTGNPFTNLNATHSVNEPFPGCRQTNGFHSVWYKFTAPPTGFVRVTNDYSGATIGNTRIGVYSTSDSSDFSMFNILACDVNNGFTVTGKSLLYVNGLLPGATYYVEVDGLNANQAMGDFCLTVDEVNNAMIADGGACVAGKSQASLNNSFRGWLSLVDLNGKLIATVRQTNPSSTSPTGYTMSVTNNTATVRQTGAQYYLDRNYLINSSGATTNPSFDVQLFFLASEQTTLQNADPSATLGNLNITRQTGSSCVANFNPSSGVNTSLLQTANGTGINTNWLQFTTPGFSNFYIMPGTTALIIQLESFVAENFNHRNLINWTTISEHRGDWFELERSADGKEFAPVIAIQAKGAPSNYNFWDDHPFPGRNFYRLKLSDAGGNYYYSHVVNAHVKESEKEFNFSAFPNPANNVLTISLSGNRGTHPTISLIDLTGKILNYLELENEGCNLNLDGVLQGVYLLKYTDSRETRTIKINKH